VTFVGAVRSARFVRLVRRALDCLLVAVVGLALLALVLGRILPFFGGTTLVVAGPSMGEAAPIGSAIILTPVDPADLAVGDIVSMRVGSRSAVFTHRIIRIAELNGEVWIETKGDANPEPDPSIVPASAVLGRVSLALPNVGYLLALLSTMTGLAFVVGLALFLVAGAWLLESVAEELETKARHALRQVDAVAPSPEAVRGDLPVAAR
jgi:signal peptidase I